jgi:AraC family transcriptional regulator, exoenzyme S synthesis regulatory protein ExsA
MAATTYTLPELFNIGNNSEYGVLFYSTNKSTYRNKVVFSKNLINFILKGEKEIYTSHSFNKVSNNQIVLLPASNVLMSELNTVEIFESIIIYFSDHFLTDFLLKYQIEIHEFGRQGIQIVPKDDFLSHYEQSLLLLKTKPNQSAIFQAKIEEIILYLLKANPVAMLSLLGNISTSDPLVRLKQIVQFNLDKNLTLEELAFLCNSSLSTFKRNFVQVFSSPPQKYFLAHKMNKAKLLLQKQMKPSEISALLGYENLSAFSKEFKKHFGVPPSNWQHVIELMG